MSAVAMAADPREPIATICDGRQTLGFIFENNDGTLTAAGPEGEVLGTFDKREAARQAVVDFQEGRS
jgi:hypothetical protein